MAEYEIRALRAEDRERVRAILIERWTALQIVNHGQLYQADELPGFVAVQHGEIRGLLTYSIEAGQCEVVSLDSLAEGQGIGTALLAAVEDPARAAGCRRVWLITTNDNLHALGFYQKRGFVLVAVHRNALAVSRRLKPSIPFIGIGGIPLRDEIELEKTL